MPPLRGSVAPEVWRRIREADSAGRTSPGRFRLEMAFARPSFAAAFVTACILAGLFLAEMRLTRLEVTRNAQLARSYLRLIDPLIAGAPPATGDLRPPP